MPSCRSKPKAVEPWQWCGKGQGYEWTYTEYELDFIIERVPWDF